MVGALIIGAVAFSIWFATLPGFGKPTWSVVGITSLGWVWRTVCQSSVTVGLLAFPVVVLAGPTRIVGSAWRRAPRATAVVAAGGTVALLVEVARNRRFTRNLLGPGNYLVPHGILGTDTTPEGFRPELFRESVLYLIALAGVAAAVILMVSVIPSASDVAARVRARRFELTSGSSTIVVIATLGYATTYLLSILLRLGPFDRYLLPFIATVAILVLGRYRRRPEQAGTRIAGGAALLGLAVLGLVYTANSASYDGAKWSVAERAADAIGNPNAVDGGWEWNGYHSRGLEDARVERRCVVLRTEPHLVDDGRHAVLSEASVWGPTGTQTWIVARRVRPC